MAVINPDVHKLMEKAEKNSKYFFIRIFRIEHQNNSKNNKKQKKGVSVKLHSMKTVFVSMKVNSKIITNQKTNNL